MLLEFRGYPKISCICRDIEEWNWYSKITRLLQIQKLVSRQQDKWYRPNMLKYKVCIDEKCNYKNIFWSLSHFCEYEIDYLEQENINFSSFFINSKTSIVGNHFSSWKSMQFNVKPIRHIFYLESFKIQTLQRSWDIINFIENLTIWPSR